MRMTTPTFLATFIMSGAIFGAIGFVIGCWIKGDRHIVKEEKFLMNKERREYLLFLLIHYIGGETSDLNKPISLMNSKEVREKIDTFELYLKSIKTWEKDTDLKYTEWQVQRIKVEKFINLNEDEND